MALHFMAKKNPLWFSKIGRKWSAIKLYFEYHGWYFPKWSARTIVLPFFHILSFRFIIKQVKCYQSLQKLKNWKKISVHFESVLLVKWCLSAGVQVWPRARIPNLELKPIHPTIFMISSLFSTVLHMYALDFFCLGTEVRDDFNIHGTIYF